MSPTIAFVLARGHNVFFSELIGAIRAELDELGVASSVTVGPFPEYEPETAYVLVPPHEWYWLEKRFGDPDVSLFRRTIFFCAEQPGTSHFDDNVHLADVESAPAVFDINRGSVRAMRRRKLGVAEHFQLGYSPVWDRWRRGAERELDVAFMGCRTDRRTLHLASYGALMQYWRSRLFISDNSTPNTAATPGFVDGEEKLALLASTRVLINLHQSDTPYFEWLRAIEAISNGCAIVSERSADYAPLNAGEHLELGRPETLGMLTQRLLDDEDRRERIAAAAYDYLRSEVPLRAAVQRLAERAEQAARAPLPARLARRRRPAALLALEDEPDEEPQPEDTTTDASLSALKVAVKDLRLEGLALRRHIRRNMVRQTRGAIPPQLEIDACSPAWASARSRISVLTTVFNYGHHIGAALDSVAGCRRPDVEIIVVDDASGDDSADRVRSWIAANPRVPALLLTRPVNMGLPHGRNAALGFARGELSFVLDADNEVYPRALDRLLHALQLDPEATFAYGILERFDHQGPVDLLNHHPWDPRKLRAGNYIDAMALLRTQALRELGGYTTDARLHGWEDYDLWCRIAERGGHGAFVREVVARYRSSPHSMLSLTEISSRIAFSVLIERCPRLMSGVTPPL